MIMSIQQSLVTLFSNENLFNVTFKTLVVMGLYILEIEHFFNL